MSALLLLSTPRITEEGTYRYARLTLPEARAFVASAESFNNSIRHPGTVELLERELLVEIGNEWSDLESHEIGQDALVVQITRRQALGAELSVEEVRDAGYELYRLTRLA